MKRSYFIAFFGLIPLLLFPQSIKTELLFISQEQIDLFPSQYPSQTIIDADIIIMGDEIEYLDSLYQIQEIIGNISITNCSSLNSLNGLNNLKKVNGDLEIGYSPSLQNFIGLEKLNHVGGSLKINRMSNIKDLQGFNAIDTIGSLIILQNEQLITLEGLEYLTHINDRFLVYGNPSLLNMSGLENLKTASIMIIKSNTELKSLVGLESFCGVILDLEIYNNDSLSSFEGMNSLCYIGRDLIISHNALLVSLDAFEHTYIGNHLEITHNYMLSVCEYDGICKFLRENSNLSYSIYCNADGCANAPQVSNTCYETDIDYSNVLPVYKNYADYIEWNILVNKTHQIPNYAITHSYYFDEKIKICDQDYSILRFPNSNREVYIRSTYQKAWYRYTYDCNEKEKTLYDYTLLPGDTIWLGWENTDSFPDSAQFSVTDICLTEFNGIKKKQMKLKYAHTDGAYTGDLTWVQGIGCLEHPFYPFAKMNDWEERDNQLLCLHINQEKIYQNPNYNTCDTNYTNTTDLDRNSSSYISPNPCHDLLNIHSSQTGNLKYQIYNYAGVLLKEASLNKVQKEVNISVANLASGVYLIKLIQQEQSEVLRFIKD